MTRPLTTADVVRLPAPQREDREMVRAFANRDLTQDLVDRWDVRIDDAVIELEAMLYGLSPARELLTFGVWCIIRGHGEVREREED